MKRINTKFLYKNALMLEKESEVLQSGDKCVIDDIPYTIDHIYVDYVKGLQTIYLER